MGKARRNRAKAPRHNPVGVGNGRDGDEDTAQPAAGQQSEAPLQTVVEQLQSPNCDEKLCGLYLLSEAFDGHTLDEVVKNRIVRIVGPLLVDPNPAIRNSAAFSLRNLSAKGGPEFCEMLVEQDIMTPLSTLILKYGDQWQPKVPGVSENDEQANTFIQAVNILWNICEGSDTALKYFNQAGLLKCLTRCLDVSVFGIDVALAVAECLYTVTEDNESATSEMQNVETMLQRMLSTQGEEVEAVLLRVLVSGILLNINKGSSLDPSLLALIMAALSSALTLDQRRVLNQLTSDVELHPPRRNSRKQQKNKVNDVEMEGDDDDEEDDSSMLDDELSHSKSEGKELIEEHISKKEEKIINNSARLLDAQQISLEILANLCSGEDEEDDVMNEDDSDSEEMSDSSIAEDSGTQENIPVTVHSDVLEAVVSLRLLTKVWDKTILPAENVCDILQDHPDCQQLLNKLSLLRSRAFLCLQNMLAVMDLEELGGCDDLYNMWLETAKLVFHSTKADDIPLLEAATSVMRAAVQRLAQAKAPQFANISTTDLQMLLNGEQQCKEGHIRANLIRSVGSIGQMLTPVNSPHLPVIGKFLLDAAFRDSELWVIAEALDCIFDVFGEDETDRIALDIGLVDKLRTLVPVLKSKVRLQKKSLGDHFHIVMTANTNLNRFISYKGKRVAKLCSNGVH